MTLSRMADQKASILMGATFVVFSISVSRALTEELPWSLTILALFSFLSSLCAVIAILPSVSKPGAQSPLSGQSAVLRPLQRARRERVDGRRAAADETEETMFRMMLHDIYQNGQVLQRRKYRYLSYAYRLFVAGLVITLVVFAVEISLIAEPAQVRRCRPARAPRP